VSAPEPERPAPPPAAGDPSTPPFTPLPPVSGGHDEGADVERSEPEH
jgi:hypothetical protein